MRSRAKKEEEGEKVTKRRKTKEGAKMKKNTIELKLSIDPKNGILDIFFLSNRNIHKSSCGLRFWASDWIERF